MAESLAGAVDSSLSRGGCMAYLKLEGRPNVRIESNKTTNNNTKPILALILLDFSQPTIATFGLVLVTASSMTGIIA